MYLFEPFSFGSKDSVFNCTSFYLNCPRPPRDSLTRNTSPVRRTSLNLPRTRLHVKMQPFLSIAKKSRGEVREWPNRRAWKARVLETGPWVQIPPSPPFLARQAHQDSQPLGSGAPELPRGNGDERRKRCRGATSIKSRSDAAPGD
jgi:hypothetical protein